MLGAGEEPVLVPGVGSVEFPEKWEHRELLSEAFVQTDRGIEGKGVFEFCCCCCCYLGNGKEEEGERGLKKRVRKEEEEI